MTATAHKTQLATYLYEADVCTISQLLVDFGDMPRLSTHVAELVCCGDLEIMEGGMFQWHGTSAKPSLEELQRAMHLLDKVESSSSPNLLRFVDEVQAGIDTHTKAQK